VRILDVACFALEKTLWHEQREIGVFEGRWLEALVQPGLDVLPQR